jgi:hypothetical protein
MIQMPRRSVTRFFIPLIDVMILLFCIFLLLPVFKETPDNPEAAAKLKSQDLEEENKRLRAENARLRKLQNLPFDDRFAVRVLEIEPSPIRKGYSELRFYEKGKKPLVIDSAAAAEKLIERHRAELEVKYPADKRPELNYLILWPREDPRYPLEGELEDYKEWFGSRKVKFTLDRRTGDGT